MAGFACGVVRMGLEWSRTGKYCGSPDDVVDNRFDVVAKVHYLHFAIILAAISSIVIVVVSLLTHPQPENKVSSRGTAVRDS